MAAKPNLSLPEVAERLCCSVDRVRALIAGGQLIAINTSVSMTSRKPRHVVALTELLATAQPDIRRYARAQAEG